MKNIILWLARVYKRWCSPALPAACRYVPTCSEYALEAVERHGATRGCLLAAGRLLRCHPFGGSGYDPVPPVFPLRCLRPASPDDFHPKSHQPQRARPAGRAPSGAERLVTEG
jgi:putative membrane protein insertion efficiency factor